MKNIFEHIDRKAVIGFGLMCAVLFGLFFYWLFATPKPSGPVTELSSSPLNGALGRELLTALAKLRSTKLDTTVFSDPVFGSLKDFGVEIASQPIGRRNPFAEFGKFGGKSAPAKPPPASGAAKQSTPLSAPPKTGTDGFDIE